MALVRILVDGYSLLHAWPELASGQARHSAAAREALIQKLTQYRDATHTPITIFFDGSFPRGAGPKPESTPDVEVLFSRQGQTADQMIERAAHRFQPYGPVLAVTDDVAERDTVIGLGGLAASCRSFILQVEGALADLAVDLKHYNRSERDRFTRRH
jgi:predicted RNA-binding protein with PIN domain